LTGSDEKTAGDVWADGGKLLPKWKVLLQWGYSSRGFSRKSNSLTELMVLHI
jgi:hypothetical protein